MIKKPDLNAPALTDTDIDTLLEILEKMMLHKKKKFTDKEMKILKKTKIYPLVKDKL